MNYDKITFFSFSWACVGVAESDSGMSLDSLQREGETAAQTVERYVKGYLAMWNVANIDIAQGGNAQQPDSETVSKATEKIRQYIKSNPPIVTLPRFYLVLYEPQVGGNGYRLSDVFRM